jgi:hypothetical protein
MNKPKPNTLTAALKQKAQGIDTTPAPVIVARAKAPARNETTRRGKVMVSGWLPIEARSSFRLIQAKHPQKRMQDLVEEAMNDLFAKYNVPQTAKGI